MLIYFLLAVCAGYLTMILLQLGAMASGGRLPGLASLLAFIAATLLALYVLGVFL